MPQCRTHHVAPPRCRAVRRGGILRALGRASRTPYPRATFADRRQVLVDHVPSCSGGGSKMDLDRRQFLVTGGLLAAAALAPSRLLAAVERHTPPMPDLSRWPDVRAQFSLAPGLLHFSSFYLASHPRPVRDAVDAFRRAL